MGTKKGQRRKTSRRAFETKYGKGMREDKGTFGMFGRTDYPRYPDDPDSPMGRMAIQDSIARMLYGKKRKK